jgi:hypothetical protein
VGGDSGSIVNGQIDLKGRYVTGAVLITESIDPEDGRPVLGIYYGDDVPMWKAVGMMSLAQAELAQNFTDLPDRDAS